MYLRSLHSLHLWSVFRGPTPADLQSKGGYKYMVGDEPFVKLLLSTKGGIVLK